MKSILGFFLALLSFLCATAFAEPYSDTAALFQNAGQSSNLFERSYAYALFPNVRAAGFGVGGARADGHVYVGRKVLVGSATLSQLSVGLQAGGEEYSEIILFEDKRALDEFESGNFEFSAGASAVAITAGASASAATNGLSAEASGGKKDADTKGVYQKGTAVFTIAKGGLMFAVAIAGQKFTFSPTDSK